MNADLFSSDNGLETALLRSSLAFGINQELQGSRSQFFESDYIFLDNGRGTYER